jgi:RNA polymerase sigma factor (sigma-70 family)
MPNDSDFAVEYILHEAATGNLQPLGLFFETLRPSLRALVRTTIPRAYKYELHVDDLVQDAMIVALQNVATFHGHTEAELASWLAAITRHCSIDAVKKVHAARVRNGKALSLENCQEARQVIDFRQENPDHLAWRTEMLKIHVRLLQLLPVNDNALLVWRLQGWSLGVLAKVFHMSKANVLKRERKSVRFLRKEAKRCRMRQL